MIGLFFFFLFFFGDAGDRTQDLMMIGSLTKWKQSSEEKRDCQVGREEWAEHIILSPESLYV